MSEDQGTKRKADDYGLGAAEKRSKTKGKKQWRVPRGDKNGPLAPRVIQPGDTGIFATCNKGREAKCVGELRDLFSEYAEALYGNDDGDDDDEEGKVEDIEKDIQAELAGIQKPEKAPLFVPVKLEVQCVVFFKTIAPVEPVSFVQKICEDAMANPTHKRTRTAKRLAPMSLMGKATAEGLESVAKEVLRPHFHQEPVTPKKFAIRPNMRNHNTLKRDAIIKQVAGLVGQPHRVDLKNYDLLIVVEIYQNVCGVSVVDHRFEELKRYNLAEIFDPTPKEAVRAEQDGGEPVKQEASEDAVVKREDGGDAKVKQEDDEAESKVASDTVVKDEDHNAVVKDEPSDGAVTGAANDGTVEEDGVEASAKQH